MGEREPRRGIHNVVVQRGGRGFHAKVGLTVAKEPGFRVKFDVHCDPWKTAVEFGLSYAWNNLPERCTRGGCEIHVTEFHGMPVDTTDAVAALEAALALFDAFAFRPTEGPRLDPESGAVVFPTHCR